MVIRVWHIICIFLLLIGGFCACGQNEDSVVKTCFLPDDKPSTVRQSFNQCGSHNQRASKWLDSLYSANDPARVIEVFKTYERGMKLADTTVSVKEFRKLKDKVFVYLRSDEEALPWDKKRNHIAYDFAFYLHSIYLYHAKKGSLKIKPDEGQAIYMSLARGKTPECIDVHNNEDSENSFGGGGTYAILLVMAIALLWGGRSLRNLKPISRLDNDDDLPVTGTVFPTPALVYNEPLHSPGQTDDLEEDEGIEEEEEELDYFTVFEENDEVEEEEAGIEEDKVEEAEIEPLTTIVDPPIQAPLSPPIFQPAKPVEAKKYYLGSPHGSIFHRVTDTFQPFETFFVLSVSPVDEHIGEITFSDDEETLQYLLNNPEMLYAVCIPDGGEYPDKPRDVAVKSPGQAKQHQGYWRLIKKIELG